MCRRYVFVLLTAFALLSIALVACNTGESDASRAMRANADGTIAALGNRIKTLEATSAEIDKKLLELDTLRGRLEDEQNRNATLLPAQNANFSATSIPANPQPVPQPTNPDGSIPTSIPVGQPTPIPAPGSLVIDRIVTARAVNNADGCATNEITLFNTTDRQIWVVAYVRNLKAGTAFKSIWNVGGDAPREYPYTSNFNAAKTCINFYIEPRTLGVNAGDYTVTVSGGTGVSAGASFKVQGAAQPTNAATPAR